MTWTSERSIYLLWIIFSHCILMSGSESQAGQPRRTPAGRTISPRLGGASSPPVSAAHSTAHPQQLFENYDLEEQLALMRAAMTTRIEDSMSPDNVTVVQGDTAMLVCTVINIGDKSVSWLKLLEPIPQLMSVNNITNTLNTRYKAVVKDHREHVLVIRGTRKEDEGTYECQVSGPKHTSLSKIFTLNVIESQTEILGDPELYVELGSKLELTCRVTSGHLTPAFIIWQKENKILKFAGGETSEDPYLEIDQEGRHFSTLLIEKVTQSDSGEYLCEPAVGPADSVIIHVLDKRTEVQAVLGEDGGRQQNKMDTNPEKKMESRAGNLANNRLTEMALGAAVKISAPLPVKLLIPLMITFVAVSLLHS